MKPNNENERYYYERRSKQYVDNPKIRATQRANFRILIQSFVGVFMNAPHDSATHEAMLLNKYQNQIFIDDQSFYPYYVAVVMYLQIDRALREYLFDKKYITYKYQLLKILAELIAGVSPDINHSKNIDIYCEKLLEVANDREKYNKYIQESIEVFESICDKWVEFKGDKYRSAIKDNQEFTKFMLIVIRGGKPQSSNLKSDEQNNLRGKVVAVRKDRNGYYYGFISKLPDDVFFHEEDNSDLDFDNIYGKNVIYKNIANSKFGIEKAKILSIVSWH